MKNFSVSVVILATDEDESLKKTVDYMKTQGNDKPEKIIIVLSRSAAQDCIQAAEALQLKYGDSVEITVQEKDGLGQAVCHGIRQVRTTHMIFFPADLAIELESIDRMISAARNEPETIFKTSRWLKRGSFIGYDKTRLFLNFFAQIFLRCLFLTRLTDLTNPVQIMPTEYERKIDWKESGFGILIEHSITPVRLGYSIKEVPAKCLPRTEGESKNSAMKTAMYLFTALRVRFTPKNKLVKTDFQL